MRLPNRSLPLSRRLPTRSPPTGLAADLRRSRPHHPRPADRITRSLLFRKKQTVIGLKFVPTAVDFHPIGRSGPEWPTRRIIGLPPFAAPRQSHSLRGNPYEAQGKGQSSAK